MKHASSLLSLCGAVALAASTLTAQTPDPGLQPIVDRFYPTDRLHPTAADERYSCYQVLEKTPAQEPSIVVAAYTDRSAGAIRILRRTAAGMFEVAAENPDTWALTGRDCQVWLHDLVFDGHQEAIVYFLGARASSGWIVKWDGAKLASLTPVTRAADGREASMLLSPVVYDLEHKGELRIVAPRAIEQLGPTQQARNPAFVYRLGPSGYEMEKGILGIMGFRADVDPRGNQRTFRLVQDSMPPYRVIVINGDRAGRNRVTAASIAINERDVVGPRDLNERTEFVSMEVPSLTNVNHLTATLTGPGEAYITVIVQDSTQRTK